MCFIYLFYLQFIYTYLKHEYEYENLCEIHILKDKHT